MIACRNPEIRQAIKVEMPIREILNREEGNPGKLSKTFVSLQTAEVLFNKQSMTQGKEEVI